MIAELLNFKQIHFDQTKEMAVRLLVRQSRVRSDVGHSKRQASISYGFPRSREVEKAIGVDLV